MKDHIFIKSGHLNVKLMLSDILYAKAERKYIRIVTTDKTHFIRGSMTWFEEQTLAHDQFCRIHKSYIVQLTHLTGFDRKSVFIRQANLPVGRHYTTILRSKLTPEIIEKNNPTTPPAGILNKADPFLNNLESKFIRNSGLPSLLIFSLQLFV